MADAQQDELPDLVVRSNRQRGTEYVVVVRRDESHAGNPRLKMFGPASFDTRSKAWLWSQAYRAAHRMARDVKTRADWETLLADYGFLLTRAELADILMTANPDFANSQRWP